MTISDGQIALNILQIVGLSLPVFAILAQIYFRMEGDEPHMHIGFVLLSGGGGLVLAALASTQFLWLQTSSPLVDISLTLLAFGFLMLGFLLYTIYDSSKKGLKNMSESNQEIKQISEVLIKTMEREDVENVQELRETESEVPEEVEDDLTLEELKEIREQTKSISNRLDKLYSPIQEAKKSLLNPRSLLFNIRTFVFIIYVIIIAAISHVYPDLSGSPVLILVSVAVAWLIPDILDKMGL